MNITQSLAAIALLPLLAGPGFANPPCRVCVPAKVIVPRAKVIFKDRIVFKEKLVVVEKPIIVRDAVSYLATIIPSNTYNTTVSVQAPPPVQQAQLTASFNAGAVQYGQAQGYTQQILAPQPVQGYAQQQYAQPQQVQQQGGDRLAAALEAINARLCNLEERAGIGQVKAAQGIPAALGKCAVCHSATMAATKGGDFVLFDKGVLAQLSERNLRGIAAKVAVGEMPPPKNKEGVQSLTQQEAAEILQWVNRQK